METRRMFAFARRLVVLSALVALPAAQAFAGEYIVLFRMPPALSRLPRLQPGTSRVQFEATLRQSNHATLSRLAARFSGPRGLPLIRKDLWLIHGAVMEMDDATRARLANDPEVLSVRENRVRSLIDDPSFTRRGPAPRRVAEPKEPEMPWGIRAIKLPELREAYPNFFFGQGVRVGVLDTGIQSGHKEFAALGGVVFNDLINHIALPYDDHGHGTHVSGTIAGKTVGIAPRVTLVMGKIFDAGGRGTDGSILEGMQWIFDPNNDPAHPGNPRVVNNSWGGPLANGVNDLRDFEAYRRALASWIAGGMIPVFAAGNSGSAPNGVPGGLPEAIAVASVRLDGKVSDFSSRGPNLWTDGISPFRVAKPDLAAPGEEVVSASPKNDYQVMSGTSMATPHVVGALALLLQIAPQLDAFQAHDLLLGSVERRGAPTEMGAGVLDVLSLIKSVAAGHEGGNERLRRLAFGRR